MKKYVLLLFSLLMVLTPSESLGNDLTKLKKRYTKREVMITMRDGVRLFTSIYEPKTKESRPIIMRRTPYSCEPYGEEFRENLVDEWKNFSDANYIIVVQDVRGHHRSEGVSEHMRPLNKNRQVRGGTATDEATDAYDTVEWLVKNTRNNGRVGLWGFSYDGFYSMMGGLKAVIWADAIQGLILIGGALLCLGILMFSMPEGPMQTFELAANSPMGNKFSLGAFTDDLTTSTFWVCLIYGIFINLQNYGIDQNYVQRYHAAKTDKDAKFSALFGGYLFIPVSALFFLIGSALYSYYAAGVAPLPEHIAAKPDYVFPYFIVNGLPVGLRGLLIASIFAAGMSTVSTSVTSAATIILTDYVRPLFHKIRRSGGTEARGNEEKHRRLELAIVRLSSFGVGLLGACVAIAMLSVESIIDAWWTLSSIFSGGMLGLFLLGCIPQQINRAAAAIGCLGGILVIGWISLADMWNLPGPHLHPYLAIVLGTCVIFLVGFCVTFLLKVKPRQS